MKTARKWIVAVREVHIQPFLIEAATAKEAIELVADGQGEMLESGFEYSHSLDTDQWTAEPHDVLPPGLDYYRG